MNLNIYSDIIISLLKNETEGLYNYYENRVNHNLFNEDDLKIINFFENNVEKDKKIIEIAAGIGQVSHYLNKNGFNKITINECDKKRFEIAKRINKEINNSCNLIKDFYQNINLEKYDYIFTMNAVSSHINNTEGINKIKNALNNGSKVIIKEGFFGLHNDTFVTDYLKTKYNYKTIYMTDTPIYIFNL
jgi:2-polyprenyl-3-methyl-5-hydroxy-6-metoxy-1,4-benzoquinol methylase